LRQEVEKRLHAADFLERLPEWRKFPPRQVINPLISCLYTPDEALKQRAALAMGEVMALLADLDMEAARVVMRRLIWSLNDESGGIGWGAPEAMGEILARHEQLAKEYLPILVSYIRADGNLLDHPMLRRGVLWGLCRVAGTRPELLRGDMPYIEAYLESPDGLSRELAARALELLRVGS
jgi:hypothetical protein